MFDYPNISGRPHRQVRSPHPQGNNGACRQPFKSGLDISVNPPILTDCSGLQAAPSTLLLSDSISLITDHFRECTTTAMQLVQHISCCHTQVMVMVGQLPPDDTKARPLS